jgi:excisionase family DNA binding protein
MNVPSARVLDHSSTTPRLLANERSPIMSTDNEFQREGLSVFEACAVAGIGRTKLYEAISTGELLARKFGKRRIILRDDLQQFLTSLPIDAPFSKNGGGSV